MVCCHTLFTFVQINDDLHLHDNKIFTGHAEACKKGSQGYSGPRAGRVHYELQRRTINLVERFLEWWETISAGFVKFFLGVESRCRRRPGMWTVGCGGVSLPLWRSLPCLCPENPDFFSFDLKIVHFAVFRGDKFKVFLL